MPLYIDLHIDNNLTPDLIKQCHIADKAIQAKYGVRYLQILLNQPQGYLFCLVEGPDKESCAKVHQEAHGNIACNILEITQSDFSALLANKKKDEADFTLNSDGTIDAGIRALLYLNLMGSPEHYRLAKEIIQEELLRNEGRTGESFDNRFMVIFDSCTSAVDAGIKIGRRISESKIQIELRMAVNIGSPLGEIGNYFEDVRKSVEYLSFISESNKIIISSKAIQLYLGDSKSALDAVRVISSPEEKFLNQVIGYLEKNWDKNEVNVIDFAKGVGISKSQLARKLKALSNLTPNDFLKEYKLRESISLLEDKNMNIAEVSMAIGFSNPSYFTKCFRKRFGTAPSDFMITA